LINFLNHRKKGEKKDFQKPNINSITFWILMIVVVVTHCWNQGTITYEKLVWYMKKPNKWNEMICFIELGSCSLRSASMKWYEKNLPLTKFLWYLFIYLSFSYGTQLRCLMLLPPLGHVLSRTLNDSIQVNLSFASVSWILIQSNRMTPPCTMGQMKVPWLCWYHLSWLFLYYGWLVLLKRRLLL